MGEFNFSAPIALFARINMSRGAYERWLVSPIKFIPDFSDWPDLLNLPKMDPGMTREYEETRETSPPPEHISARPTRQVRQVKKFLESMADSSQYFCCEYDDDRGALYIADAGHKSGAAEIAATLAALRNVSSFKDEDGPGFIYVFPAISGGDPEALLRIERGASDFLPVGESSPEVLYFVNEAEEFIETMLEDDD